MRPSLLQMQMMMAAGAQRMYASWNPADRAANISLANANTRASTTVNSSGGSVRSDTAIVGKVYFELDCYTATTAGSVLGAGIADATEILTNFAGSSNKSCGLWPPAGQFYFNNAVINTTATGLSPRVQYAVDATSRKVWARVNGGSWIGGGDPVAGTTPTCTLSGTGSLYAYATPWQTTNGVYIDLIPNPTGMSGSAPSGFTAGLFT